MQHLIIAGFTMLEVRRNGEVSSRTEFCNGDDLILTCIIDNIGAYLWTVSGLVMGNDGGAVVGLAASTREVNGLTFNVNTEFHCV